ncbi:MAG: hypothetical protein ACFE0Q_19675 [Anaerolineae bacterium]
MVSVFAGWTREDVTHLALELAIAQEGQRLAQLGNTHWHTLASDDTLIWAIFQHPRTRPQRMVIDLEQLRAGACVAHCTCERTLALCQHVLAMLYIIVEQPQRITSHDIPPDWTQRPFTPAQQTVISATAEQMAHYQTRLRKRTATIQNGISELEQWLINMIRRGLADPQIRSYDFWDSRAARMVDAQAPGIASWLYHMGSIPAQGQDWLDPLLNQLGRLYLLIESFKRFDTLSPELQADLRMVVGWYLKRDEMIHYDTLMQKDDWVVMGRFTGEMNDHRNAQNPNQRRLRTQRIWLRGVQSGKDALILEFAFGASRFDTRLIVGQAVQANLCYYPSRYPLRAFATERYGMPFDGMPITGLSILDNIERYAHALTRNPWLQQYPFLLADMIPTEHEGHWVIRDHQGAYLPLSQHFTQHWHLLALSGGYPVQLAGEWDGQYLLPTGALADGRYVDFEMG